MILMEFDLIVLVVCFGESFCYLGEQVSMVEFCIGGGIVEVIICILGSLGWFEVGYVIYLNCQKIFQLEVFELLFLVVGVVSWEVVEVMVCGVQWYSGVCFVVVVSGVVGFDGGLLEKLVGMVWLVWVDGEWLVSECCQFNGDCDVVCWQMVVIVLIGLLCMSNGENLGQLCLWVIVWNIFFVGGR